MFEGLSLTFEKSNLFQVPRISCSWHRSFVAQVCGAYAGCISGVLRLKSLDAALHIIATSRVLALHRSRIREKKNCQRIASNPFLGTCAYTAGLV